MLSVLGFPSLSSLGDARLDQERTTVSRRLMRLHA